MPKSTRDNVPNGVGPSARAAGFVGPPHELFNVREADMNHKMRDCGYSVFAARKAVVRERVLSLVLRKDPLPDLQQIVLFAMLEGYL